MNLQNDVLYAALYKDNSVCLFYLNDDVLTQKMGKYVHFSTKSFFNDIPKDYSSIIDLGPLDSPKHIIS